MRIVIYNSSSFGGCFDYGKALLNAYSNQTDIENTSWWIPQNAAVPQQPSILKLGISDKPETNTKWMKQLHFLYRVIGNPIRLFWFLRKQPTSWVILNDFEQLSAILWVPLYRFFLRKHRFAVVLHDPDRDAYPPSLWFTKLSMKLIMGLVRIGIYHDYLPDKPYYRNLKVCKLLDLPHGFYPMPEPDEQMFSQLSAYTAVGKTTMAILGNIRAEKNYHLAIEALTRLPNHILIVAGSASNARVDIGSYKKLAHSLSVENQVVWIERFLTEPEMAAVIEISDVILLNYAVSFTSQSGILNVVAPFRKELIVSDGPSSLASILRRFGVGELVAPGSVDSLVVALQKLENEDVEIRQHWEDYLHYASWETHVMLAIKAFKTTT